MEKNKIIGNLHFSITENEIGTTTLDRTYADYCDDFGSIHWLIEEFKYFLKAMSFSEQVTDRIVFLNEGEKVIDENGDVIVECK